jgi:ribonuclease Z
MTCSVRILSTTSVDSSPAILLVAPNGNKTLVNCGEGCQRVFLEFSQKLSTVNRVCLTHLSHSTLGGLPGMILTSADVMTASAVSAAKQNAESQVNNSSVKPPKRPVSPSTDRPGLDIVGPKGVDAFIHSLRHFMRREAFELRIHSGEYCQQQESKNTPNAKRRKTSKNNTATQEEDLHVQSIACEMGTNHHHHPPHHRRQALSYIFTTPPIQGKLLVDKAKQMGIPPGPLYGQLKSGKAVTFVNPKTGEEERVESKEVVEVGSPGVAVAILYYPDLNVLDQLKGSESLSKLLPDNTQSNTNTPTIELMVHITSRASFDSTQCSSWRANLSQEIQHVFLDTDLPASVDDDPGTPFHSTSAGATCRSKLSSDIFASPCAVSDVQPRSELDIQEASRVTKAVPLLEYTIIPRGKKGFSNQQRNQQHRCHVDHKLLELLESSRAVDLAREAVDDGIKSPEEGEIIFTGTGSAIPCKHRNVSGIYLQMSNRNGMLLDIGEGTVGQLARAKHHEKLEDILRRIRAVWISHPHADHHLGILRLLAERNELLGDREKPIVVIAPTNLRSFLKEYEDVDPHLAGSYVFLDCRDVSYKAQASWLSTEQQQYNQAIYDRLRTELGITGVQSVPVQHCAHSYAVELRGTSFGTVAYSGDCRPSRNFAAAALNADLLIHEATFTDGMEAEASLKRHCTVGEALEIGSLMKAKAVVLTHFSQRFPKIPPLSGSDASSSNTDVPVVFAFDYMKLTPTNLLSASKITPALRLLYPEDTTVDEDDEVEEAVGSEALAIPGLFAQKELL